MNLFVDCFPTDRLWLHLGFGYSKPGDAAEEVLGDDDAFFAQPVVGFFYNGFAVGNSPAEDFPG